MSTDLPLYRSLRLASYATLTSMAIALIVPRLVAQEELPPAEIAAPTDPAGVIDGAEAFSSGAEPLLRGPVHEAFAEPLTLEPGRQAMLIAQEPPPLIEEVPPEQKPDGTDVAWIPGYWSWDEDRSDYVWVSGVWRKIPQGRAWVAGKWEKVAAGYQWIPGRWMPTAAEQANADLLPLPPDTLEMGPNQDAPSEQHFWIPGSWQFREQRYVWRPGFWSPCQENWVWVPDHYVPVVGGCVYVSGYWDYGWERRGVLYAPCYIDRTLAYRPGFRYSPSVVVNVTDSFFHLWVRPSYRHYYFGDYYDARYTNWGIMPWYAYHRSSAWAYDPLFVHYRWRFGRDNVDLRSHLYRQHDYYRRHIDDRPVHAYRHGHDDHREGRGDRAVVGGPGGRGPNSSWNGRPGERGHDDRGHDRVLGYRADSGAHRVGFGSRDELRQAVLERQQRNREGDGRDVEFRAESGRPGGGRDRLSSQQGVMEDGRRPDLDADLPRSLSQDGQAGRNRQRGRDFSGSPQADVVNPRGVPNRMNGEWNGDRGRDAFRRAGGDRQNGAADAVNRSPQLTVDQIRARTGRERLSSGSIEDQINRNLRERQDLGGRERPSRRDATLSVPSTSGPVVPPSAGQPAVDLGRVDPRFRSREGRPSGGEVLAAPGAAAARRAGEMNGSFTTPRGRLNGFQSPGIEMSRPIPSSRVAEPARGRMDNGRARTESFRVPVESRPSFDGGRAEAARSFGEVRRGGGGGPGRGGDAVRSTLRGDAGGGRGNMPGPPRGGGGRGRGGRD